MTDERVWREIVTSADVTQEILDDAEQVLDGWFSGQERIAWDDFIDRLETAYGSIGDPPYCFPAMDDPGVRKIKDHIRALRVQG